MSNSIPIEWAAPEAALAIRYSHPDHLRSAAVVTDLAGEVVEETAFHPFGPVRNEQRSRPVEESYKYTQKERDRESGLHYYEARYLAASLARFSRPDTKYAAMDSLSKEEMESLLANPQSLNPYTYVRNNPIKFIDPQGEDAVKPRTDQTSYTLTLKRGGESVNIPITSVSTRMRPVGQGSATRDPKHDSPAEFYITRQADRQSIDLMRDVMSGKSFDEATVTVRSPGKNKEFLFQIRLTEAHISSITRDVSHPIPSVETIGFSGEDLSFITPKTDGPAGPPQPQSTPLGIPVRPAFDVDKAAKQTAKDFQEVLSGSQSK